ncbi:EAL domain-containing response regulator [Halomonas sp. BM-2019]|uniref:EAL domain-containing response regulator n=1 Tax=Halomonas sp. BM-2019 TaxID=2811227 RepID=UPI001B3C2363|nr:MAG: EAL domain-containing response regulator [Halomonas sp. BM-2019]
MNDSSPAPVALVLDADPDVAAVLSLQLERLGLETRYHQRSAALLAAVVARPPRLVVLGLEVGSEDAIALLRRLADSGYRGWVLLLSGVERKIARIAERVGHTLGLQMLGCLDKPMRLPDLRHCLGNLRAGCVAPREARGEPLFTGEELDQALSRDELTIHYQPQFELSSGRLSGVEALVRWVHPTLGIIGPARFLPLLSRDQARRLTRRVLALAQADAARWLREGVAPSLSVNVTADDLMSPDLLSLVCRRPPGDPPLVLEITETAAMHDELLGSEVAARLCLGGLEVSVDDFGIGFSSLSRLQLLPISELKVDRSFVQHLHEASQDAAIVEAVALLGRRLGIRVVAEGVEDPACLALLERFGCTHVQGYGLARPMPAEAILEVGATQDSMRASSAASGAPLGSTP